MQFRWVVHVSDKPCIIHIIFFCCSTLERLSSKTDPPDGSGVRFVSVALFSETEQPPRQQLWHNRFSNAAFERPVWGLGSSARFVIHPASLKSVLLDEFGVAVILFWEIWLLQTSQPPPRLSGHTHRGCFFVFFFFGHHNKSFDCNWSLWYMISA